MLQRQYILTVIVVLAALCAVGLRPVADAANPVRIAVLTSHSAEPYEHALAGLQQYLRQQGVAAAVEVYPLEGDAAKAARFFRGVHDNRPHLLVALGALAMQAARKERVDFPVVAGLVLKAEEISKTPNTTGVVLEFPVETEFQWLQRFLSATRTIGVLYNPEENQPRIAAATQAARQLGLRLETQAVRSPKEIPEALDNLANRVDVLWGVVDATVLTPETAKHILLFSFRNRIPFVGVSASWVKAGALYALDWDYTDLGRQCGELALKVLQGTPTSALAPVAPRIVKYTLNLRTARHMKVEIPPALSSGAREVYE